MLITMNRVIIIVIIIAVWETVQTSRPARYVTRGTKSS